MRLWLHRLSIGTPAVAGAVVVALYAAAPVLFAARKHAPPTRPPVRATLQPSFTVPAGPLGFAAAAEDLLGARQSLVSLDFLGEDRLLFTFQVPGLIHRGAANADEYERRIRAVVLGLPRGNVEAETVWTVHDRDRYLYALPDGHFLLRDQETLALGDGSLELKPYLHFPGNVRWVDVDPSGEYLVTISDEPPNRSARKGDVDSPETARAQMTVDGPPREEEPDLVLRILRRDSGQVMLVSHIRYPIHLPIDGDGYLDSLQGNGMAWDLDLKRFEGGTQTIGTVNSVCSPVLNFVSAREFLAITCGREGEPRLVAISTNGRHMWETPPDIPAVWPVLASSSNGLRMAWESLLVNHSLNAAAPMGSEDIKGQDVQIMDAASGKLVLRAAASPIFDAGGNVAISPSGRRVAIIMGGDIQVFDLPAPPALPDTLTHQAAR